MNLGVDGSAYQQVDSAIFSAAWMVPCVPDEATTPCLEYDELVLETRMECDTCTARTSATPNSRMFKVVCPTLVPNKANNGMCCVKQVNCCASTCTGSLRKCRSKCTLGFGKVVLHARYAKR